MRCRPIPDINMLVTSSDFLTPQIEQALRTAGKWRVAGQPGHVLIAGFDGDDKGYEQLAAGYYDVDGVQNLDYEVDLALQALDRLWAGQFPAKILIDPGFVITRATLEEKRDRMWGYAAWKKQAAVAQVSDANAVSAGSTRRRLGRDANRQRHPRDILHRSLARHPVGHGAPCHSRRRAVACAPHRVRSTSP